jgi:undecaprenyl pyrophosphate phosphatase UppP
VAFLVTLFSGLLAIGGFMKHVQRKGFGGYIAYRCVLAIGAIALYWSRNQAG